MTSKGESHSRARLKHGSKTPRKPKSPLKSSLKSNTSSSFDGNDNDSTSISVIDDSSIGSTDLIQSKVSELKKKKSGSAISSVNKESRNKPSASDSGGLTTGLDILLNRVKNSDTNLSSSRKASAVIDPLNAELPSVPVDMAKSPAVRTPLQSPAALVEPGGLRAPPLQRASSPPVGDSGDLPTAAAAESFAVMQEVDCVVTLQNGSTRWFPGRVAMAHGDGTFDIHFDDGDVRTRVQPDNIRASKRRFPRKSIDSSVASVSVALSLADSVSSSPNRRGSASAPVPPAVSLPPLKSTRPHGPSGFAVSSDFALGMAALSSPLSNAPLNSRSLSISRDDETANDALAHTSVAPPLTFSLTADSDVFPGLAGNAENNDSGAIGLKSDSTVSRSSASRSKVTAEDSEDDDGLIFTIESVFSQADVNRRIHAADGERSCFLSFASWL